MFPRATTERRALGNCSREGLAEVLDTLQGGFLHGETVCSKLQELDGWRLLLQSGCVEAESVLGWYRIRSLQNVAEPFNTSTFDSGHNNAPVPNYVSGIRYLCLIWAAEVRKNVMVDRRRRLPLSHRLLSLKSDRMNYTINCHYVLRSAFTPNTYCACRQTLVPEVLPVVLPVNNGPKQGHFMGRPSCRWVEGASWIPKWPKPVGHGPVAYFLPPTSFTPPSAPQPLLTSSYHSPLYPKPPEQTLPIL